MLLISLHLFMFLNCINAGASIFPNCYREWFRQSCLTSKELTTQTEADDLMLQSLLHLLSEPESILIIASR